MDPLSIASMLGAGGEAAASAYHAAKLFHHVGAKYLPTVKRSVGHLFSSRSRQTAKDYLRGLTTKKGITQAVTKDIPSAAKAASKYVRSGKMIKSAKEVASDTSKLVGAVEGVTGPSKYTKGVQKAVETGLSTVQGVHEHANKFLTDFAQHNNRRSLGMS